MVLTFLAKNTQRAVTPLMCAARNSHKDAIIALCAAGADPRLGDLSPLDADVNCGITGASRPTTQKEGTDLCHDVFFAANQ